MHFYQIPDTIKNARSLKKLGYKTDFLRDYIHVVKESKEGYVVNERFHTVGEFLIFSNLIIKLATSVNPDIEDTLLFDDLVALRKKIFEKG